MTANVTTGHGDEIRPDGRAISSKTARLRLATRALRYHLDELPIDYRLDVPGDRYLVGLAFMFARQRYDCAESLIGACGLRPIRVGDIDKGHLIDDVFELWATLAFGQRKGRGIHLSLQGA